MAKIIIEIDTIQEKDGIQSIVSINTKGNNSTPEHTFAFAVAKVISTVYADNSKVAINSAISVCIKEAMKNGNLDNITN